MTNEATRIGYEGDLTHLQSTFGVQYAKWKADNLIHSTARFHDIWKESQIFPTPYSKRTTKPVTGIDGNDWYPSYASCSYYSTYKFPVSGTEIAISNPPDDVLLMNGTCHVTFTSWHPFVELQMKSRLSNWLPCPVLKFLHDSKQAEFTIHTAIVVVSSQDITMPTHADPKGGHHWGRIAFGRLIANNDCDYIVTNSVNERNSIVSSLNVSVRRGPVETLNLRPQTKNQTDAEWDVEKMLESLDDPVSDDPVEEPA